MLSETQFKRLLQDVVNGLRVSLAEELHQEIARSMEQYRRSVWAREQWCCNNMREFATKFWGAPTPRTTGMWSISYQIQGYNVNYCPFCGGYVGQAPPTGDACSS